MASIFNDLLFCVADYEQSLRLDPKLLTFEPTSRHILGEGGFGIVYQATYDNQDVAIKTFSVNKDGYEMAYKKLRTVRLCVNMYCILFCSM